MIDYSKEPISLAFEDYISQSDSPELLKLHIENGDVREIDVTMFFEKPEDFLEIDKIAYDLCRGRILDIGAGAGRFALPLHERGLPIYAVEQSPIAVSIMREKGLQDVYSGDIDLFLAQSWTNERFDTVLMMMNGIGIVETLDKLELFFDQIRPFIKADGQIIADSTDVRLSHFYDFSEHIAIQKVRCAYLGEVQMRFEYKGNFGSKFSWLHVDEETLALMAEKKGWKSEVLYRGNDGEFLTRLTLLS